MAQIRLKNKLEVAKSDFDENRRLHRLIFINFLDQVLV